MVLTDQITSPEASEQLHEAGIRLPTTYGWFQAAPDEPVLDELLETASEAISVANNGGGQEGLLWPAYEFNKLWLTLPNTVVVDEVTHELLTERESESETTCAIKRIGYTADGRSEWLLEQEVGETVPMTDAVARLLVDGIRAGHWSARRINRTDYNAEDLV